tara:strand:- start:946 stop:1122 length:177 start_codon:yes stop_codon:yes gene_type:complete
MTAATSQLMDALCWTPAAPIIRAARRYRIQNKTQEQSDVHRISTLLNTIMHAHGDMLS